MAGFTYYKDVANYSVLAHYYDSLLSDEESLALWIDKINQYAKGKKLLELASGSGVMARLLVSEGYDVIASDISEDMKEVAKKNFDGEYLILNMIDFKLDQKFDVILCIADSMNYIADYNEMKKMFKNVYDHLNDGGIFVFDMHHVERINEFADEYIEEGYVDDVPYQWTIQSDSLENILMEHFVFYEEDGVLEEHHVQQVFDYEQTVKLMEECGYETHGYNNFIPDEKVLIVGVK